MSTNLTEASKCYLKAIYEIFSIKGGVRVKDIAEQVGVKNSSVTVALRNLRDNGYINYEPYGVISLTKQGVMEANRISTSHTTCRIFLENILDIEKNTTEKIAGRLEHTLGSDVMIPFSQFVNCMLVLKENGLDWEYELRKYQLQSNTIKTDSDSLKKTSGNEKPD